MSIAVWFAAVVVCLLHFLKNYFLEKYVKMSLLLDAADSDDSE